MVQQREGAARHRRCHIITGETSARQCAPDRAHADEDLLAALNGVTNWRMERSALVLTGSRTLRFRPPSN